MFLQTFSLEPALQTPCFVISCNGKTAQPRWGRSRAGSGSVLVVSPDKNQNPAQYNICVGTAKPSSPRFPESPTEQLPAMIPVPGPQRAWQGGAKGSSPMCSHTNVHPGSARGCQVSPGGQGGTARASCPPLIDPRRREPGWDGSSAGERAETPRLLPAEPLRLSSCTEPRTAAAQA